MTISRRSVLLALGGSAALAACRSEGTAGPAAAGSGPPGADPLPRGGPVPEPVRHTYGTDPAQFGELTVPARRTHAGVVVILHGGFWRAQYDLSLGRPLAADLATRGYAVWNLEYRRVGDGGGWPVTFEDVAAGVDRLAGLDVDASHVVAIGHSAGGHLATWAAGRGTLSPGSPGAAPVVAVTAVVSQAGVLALAQSARDGVGGTAAEDLMGGPPDRVPDRYRIGDPLAAIPLTAPVLCVHSPDDPVVPIGQSLRYLHGARAAGADVTLHRTAGDHFSLIDPASPDWAVVLSALPDLITR